jgi:hypothetical protein
LFHLQVLLEAGGALQQQWRVGPRQGCQQGLQQHHHLLLLLLLLIPNSKISLVLLVECLPVVLPAGALQLCSGCGWGTRQGSAHCQHHLLGFWQQKRQQPYVVGQDCR